MFASIIKYAAKNEQIKSISTTSSGFCVLRDFIIFQLDSAQSSSRRKEAVGVSGHNSHKQLDSARKPQQRAS